MNSSISYRPLFKASSNIRPVARVIQRGPIRVSFPQKWLLPSNSSHFSTFGGDNSLLGRDPSSSLLEPQQTPSVEEHQKRWPLYPDEWYAEEKNQRWWLTKLAEDFNVKDYPDWYKVRDYDVIQRQGLGLLKQHEFNFYKTIRDLFPEYSWIPWKFAVVPKGFWGEPKNQRWYLEWLAKELKIEKWEDWYKVRSSNIAERGGVTLLWYHKESVGNAVKNLYPEYDFKLWLFEDLPKTFWTNKDIQKDYVHWLAGILKIQKNEDWYNVRDTDFIQNRGLGFLQQYGRSISGAINSLFPEWGLEHWKFGGSLPRGFWEDKKNQKSFLEFMYKDLKMESQEDWYKVRKSSLVARSGSGLLNQYDKHLSSAIMANYPDVRWQPWRFDKPPKDFWLDKKNQMDAIEWMTSQFNIKELDDWYGISIDDVIDKGGAGLLQQYGDSLYNTLQAIYPNHDWKRWGFHYMPREFWDDKNNHYKCMDWLAKRLSIHNLDDWYKVSVGDMFSKGGAAILAQYGKSLGQILCTLYPDHPWDIWKLDRVPPKYWEKQENQKRFVDQLTTQLNVKEMEDWYKVKSIDIASRGGSSFLAHFGNSLGAALSSLFPEHKWKLWKFGQVPKGFWDNKENVFEYLDWLGEQYGIHNVLSDWSKLPKRMRGNLRQISKSNNILANIASEELDNVIFDEWATDKTKKLVQSYLYNVFPGKEVLLDSQQAPLNQFDVLVPSLNLAFEYQGKLDQDQLSKYQKRFEDKKKVATEVGITLIEIPYWWDCTNDSLKATIHHFRPELIKERLTGSPIPEAPAPTY